MLKRVVGLAFCGLLLSVLPALAQAPKQWTAKDPGDLADARPNQPERPDAPTPRPNVADPAALMDRTDVNWRRLPKNFMQEQKDM